MNRVSALVNAFVWYVVALIFLGGGIGSVFLLHLFPRVYGWWEMAVFAIPISAICARVWNMFEKAEDRWEALAPAFWLEARVATPVVGMTAALVLRLLLNSPYLTDYFGWAVLALGGMTALLFADAAFSRRSPLTLDLI